MAQLTRVQTRTIEHALRAAERARTYIMSEHTAVCVRSHGTTTLDYIRPSDGAALYEVERAYGSDLTGLDEAIHTLRLALVSWGK